MDNLYPLGLTLRRPSSAPATEPSLVVRCRGAAVEPPDGRGQSVWRHTCVSTKKVPCTVSCSVDLFRGSRRRGSSYAAGTDIPGQISGNDRPLSGKYPDIRVSWTDSSLGSHVRIRTSPQNTRRQVFRRSGSPMASSSIRRTRTTAASQLWLSLYRPAAFAPVCFFPRSARIQFPWLSTEMQPRSLILRTLNIYT